MSMQEKGVGASYGLVLDSKGMPLLRSAVSRGGQGAAGRDVPGALSLMSACCLLFRPSCQRRLMSV